MQGGNMGILSKPLFAKWRFAFAIIAIALAATNAIAQTGALCYIKIVEGPAGNGPELVNKALTADQALVVHAAGFDASNNCLGDVSVNWSLSGGVGTLDRATEMATTFEARTFSVAIIAAKQAVIVFLLQNSGAWMNCSIKATPES